MLIIQMQPDDAASRSPCPVARKQRKSAAAPLVHGDHPCQRSAPRRIRCTLSTVKSLVEPLHWSQISLPWLPLLRETYSRSAMTSFSSWQGGLRQARQIVARRCGEPYAFYARFVALLFRSTEDCSVFGSFAQWLHCYGSQGALHCVEHKQGSSRSTWMCGVLLHMQLHQGSSQLEKASIYSFGVRLRPHIHHRPRDCHGIPVDGMRVMLSQQRGHHSRFPHAETRWTLPRVEPLL